jgi:hypothetical protein
MSRTRLRQVARLEKRALPYIAQKRRDAEERAASEASKREKNFITVANLAVLILYGNPKVGEPLTCAWQRCLESEAWKACRERHPRIGAEGRGKESPFNDQGARSIAQYFREYILPGLPGTDETKKLNAVLAKAPPWLLWFAHAEIPILSLGLKLPDLSRLCHFDRPEAFGHLPDGAFERRRLPEGVEDDELGFVLGLIRRDPAVLARLSPRERIACERMAPIPQANLTPRERMRALRTKQKRTTSGSWDGSPQAQTDEWREFASVAALLRAMSRDSGLIPGARLPDKASDGKGLPPSVGEVQRGSRHSHHRRVQLNSHRSLSIQPRHSSARGREVA